MCSSQSLSTETCFCTRFVEPLRKLHEARKILRKKRASKTTGTALSAESNLKEPGEGANKWKVVMISRRAVDFMQKVLVYLIGEIVNGMMGYVPLSVIMDKLLSNNGKHEFGDFKGTILQMLGLYGYEQAILVLTCFSGLMKGTSFVLHFMLTLDVLFSLQRSMWWRMICFIT